MKKLFLSKIRTIFIIIILTLSISNTFAHDFTPNQYHPAGYQPNGAEDWREPHNSFNRNAERPDIDLRDIRYYPDINGQKNVFAFEVCNNSDWGYREEWYGNLNLDVTINGETHRVIMTDQISARSCINIERPNIFDTNYVHRGEFTIKAVFTYANGQTGGLFSKQMYIEALPGDRWAGYNPDSQRRSTSGENKPYNYDLPNFVDIDSNSIVWDAVQELYRRGIISNSVNGRFNGQINITRAEAVKIILLARYGSIDYEANYGRYPDIPAGAWYESYMVKAAEMGIINGSNRYLKPADNVNTAEFLTMLARAFNLETNLYYPYYDVSSAVWYTKYVGVAYKYGLFLHRGNRLEPSKSITRNEAVVTIYQYLTYQQ